MANWGDKSEKIKKAIQKYKYEYSKQYNCIVKSSKSDVHAFFTICSADISISLILEFCLPFFNFAGWHLCMWWQFGLVVTLVSITWLFFIRPK